MPTSLYGFALDYETCKKYYETHQVHILHGNESDVEEGLRSPEMFEEVGCFIVSNIANDIKVNHDVGPGYYGLLWTRLARIPRERFTTVVVLTLTILRTQRGQRITKEMCDTKAAEVSRELIDFIKQRVGLTEEPKWHRANNSTAFRDPASSSEEEEETSSSGRFVLCIIARSLVHTLMKPLEQNGRNGPLALDFSGGMIIPFFSCRCTITLLSLVEIIFMAVS